MKFFLTPVFVMAISVTPLAAQGVTLVGTWLGEAPGSRGKDGLKVEIAIARDGDKWSLDGILYKNGEKLTTFKGKDFKAKGVQMLEFTEETEKAPTDWPKPTKVVLKVSPGTLVYERELGKKRTFAFLRPKTPELFAQVVLGKEDRKNPNSGAPIPSDDPNKMLFGVGPLHAVLFTADGKTMVTAAGDSVIRIWDFAARKQTSAIVADKGLGCLTITPEGKFFAGGVGNTTVLWDAEGKEIARFGDHIYGVSGVALSPDGKTLISTDDGTTTADRPDGNTKLWDVAGKKEIANIPFCGKRTLALVPDADRFVLLNGRYVKNPKNPLQSSFVHYYKIYNVKGKLLQETATNHHIVRHTVLSPDKKLLLAADLLGNINLLNVVTGKIQRTLKNRPFDYINTVAFTPDGKQFAVGGSGGQVVLYDTASGKELKTLKVLKSEMTRMAISPDGRWLVSAGSNENAVVVTALKE